MTPDREKVINGVHNARRYLEGREWTDNSVGVHIDALNDALAMLKEQEAEPEIEGGGSTWWYVCSECRGAIDDNDRFCKHCGARLKRTVK